MSTLAIRDPLCSCRSKVHVNAIIYTAIFRIGLVYNEVPFLSDCYFGIIPNGLTCNFCLEGANHSPQTPLPFDSPWEDSGKLKESCLPRLSVSCWRRFAYSGMAARTGYLPLLLWFSEAVAPRLTLTALLSECGNRQCTRPKLLYVPTYKLEKNSPRQAHLGWNLQLLLQGQESPVTALLVFMVLRGPGNSPQYIPV